MAPSVRGSSYFDVQTSHQKMGSRETFVLAWLGLLLGTVPQSIPNLSGVMWYVVRIHHTDLQHSHASKFCLTGGVPEADAYHVPNASCRVQLEVQGKPHIYGSAISP